MCKADPKGKYVAVVLLICVLAAGGCQRQTRVSRGLAVPPNAPVKPLPANAPPQLKQMLDGAIAQAGVTTSYDPAYVALDDPGGDVSEKPVFVRTLWFVPFLKPASICKKRFTKT